MSKYQTTNSSAAIVFLLTVKIIDIYMNIKVQKHIDPTVISISKTILKFPIYIYFRSNRINRKSEILMEITMQV